MYFNMNKDQKFLAEAYSKILKEDATLDQWHQAQIDKEAGGLEQAIVKALEQHDPEINYKKFAAVVSSILKDQFGQHLVNDFIAELQKNA